MQCVYCRPAGFATRRDPGELSPQEIESVVRHLTSRHDLRKLRLTGGEPTTRPDLEEIIGRLAGISGLEDLAMTTNGLTLTRQAEKLKAAGLRRINISLDSLSPERFFALTGVNELQRVLDGLAAAVSAGLAPIKLNVVVVRGQNDQELPSLLRFAADQDLEIRFIELMPMGPLHANWAQRYVAEAEMRRSLDCIVKSWKAQPMGADSARRSIATLVDERTVKVGFITAMSHPFCADCDRIRIGCTGDLYPCLMDAPSANLMQAIRPEFDSERFDDLLREGLRTKASEHPARGTAVMIQVGG